MSINRYQLVSRHNVKNDDFDYYSPVSVGNGEFAYTVDVTGLQTLYEEYEPVMPLCTMSNFGWNRVPEKGSTYTLDDLTMNRYTYNGRQVFYPKSSLPREEHIYQWLRVNPHRVNLFRLGLKDRKNDIKKEQLSDISQELMLYQGRIASQYKINGVQCRVQTACHSEKNILGITVESDLLADQTLSLMLEFPYGSETISGAEWNREEAHESRIEKLDEQRYLITRQLDDLEYQVLIHLEKGKLVQENVHQFAFLAADRELKVTIYADQQINREEKISAGEIAADAARYWKEFWETTGIIDFSGSVDPRAAELERRVILSLYLLRIQCAGSVPPAETGLTCNSWYGKFHLEMHFWHCAYLPLFNQADLLKKSLYWYRDHLQEARDNAARNRFKGARWPKMVGNDGLDTPSPIAPLLIWQQPHILYLLEMLYQKQPEESLLEEFWEVVRETADFMADFAVYNEEKKCYELVAPLIPVQECHAPEQSKNPAFELEYWYEGLKIAIAWAGRRGVKPPDAWQQVMAAMAPLPVKDGVYLAHENAPDTFETYPVDHPSMLMACGLLPGQRADRETMRRTLQKVLDTWDFDTAWGWDFAVMAMTAVRLGEPELAVDLLMKDTQKNQYTKNGHNRQGYRQDLPLYLPGNGSLLLAAAAMTAGFKGSEAGLPGLPERGWKVCFENIDQLP